jgi:hypothetical protein
MTMMVVGMGGCKGVVSGFCLERGVGWVAWLGWVGRELFGFL